VTYDVELADRVRSALAAQPSVREVTMFGGLSFMVNGAMVTNVGSAGDLLVRVDPERNDDYLQVTGAHSAEMGPGRTMGRGWLAVDSDAVAADEDLAFWVDAALDYNRRAGKRPRREKRRRAAP
jgi:TfoX/Sxy family transcriptional regulator of competence genes